MNYALRLVVVTLDSSSGRSSVKATSEHPFWVQHKGWVAAIDLQPGDQLLDEDGEGARVYSTALISEQTSTFNLSVPGTEAFFVLSSTGDAVLVHNSSGGKWWNYDLREKVGGRWRTYYTGRAAPGQTESQVMSRHRNTFPIDGDDETRRFGQRDKFKKVAEFDKNADSRRYEHERIIKKGTLKPGTRGNKINGISERRSKFYYPNGGDPRPCP